MCTGIRFTSENGDMYFGRNLDWTVSYGEKVVITPRNYAERSAFETSAITEVKPAVIGMGIVVDDTPLYFDCANEHGLAIAGLNFPGYAAYEPEPIDGKLNIAAYEFPLFIARNFKTVAEVETALKNAAIIAKPINDQYPVSELHWLIADQSKSIVVEYTNHGLEIHQNHPDVLTNQPGYDWHHENLRNYMNLFSQMPKEVKWQNTILKPFGSGSLMQGLPGGYSSSNRFVRVAYLNSHYPTKTTEDDNISRLFHTLNGVAMIDGAAKAHDGNFEITLYTSGYSQKTKTYYYNTYDSPAIIATKLSDFDLDQTTLILA